MSNEKADKTVFRVTGIPLTATVGQLAVIFSSEFGDDGVALDIKETTIFPSCYNDGTQTALTQFKPHPPPNLLKYLSSNSTYDIEFEDNDISIEKDFYGLTQLYPTTGIIKADVVAVTGLNGNAYGSWRGRGNLRRMWLRNFFSKDFPDCRTMIYGFNSKPNTNGTHTILDYAKTLLGELSKARRSEREKKRPLVLIGHSFGGIIIAQSLIRAREDPSTYGSLFTSTRAVIFFGTPHRGLPVDDIITMYGEGSSREDLVRSLEQDSKRLEPELERFINCCEDLKIITFNEANQTRKLVQGPDGRYSRSGEPFTALEKKSSVLHLPVSIEKVYLAEGDHSEMVKFDNKRHQSYTSVVEHLKNFILAWNEPHYITAYDAVVNKSAGDLQRILSTNPSAIREEHDENKTTLLHAAIRGGDERIISILLEKRADVDAVDSQGNTPLHLAICGGNEEIVRQILNFGASIKETCKGYTALQKAAIHGHTNLVQLFLSNGVNVATAGGDTSLHLAAHHGNEEMVEVLLAKGADITATNKAGETALHLAAADGHEKAVKVLLANGAETTTETAEDGYTALHLAAFYGDEGLVKVLLAEGADITKMGNGVTLLHIAARFGNEKLVKLLLREGAEIATLDKSGRTALNYAAISGHEKVVGMLLAGGASVTRISNWAGLSQLHIAAMLGYEKVVELLLAKGTEVTAKLYGYTALYFAVCAGQEKVVKVLLAGGAKVTETDKDGITLLQTAAWYGHTEVVEVLLAEGADITATRADRYTTLKIAAMFGYENVVGLLLANGAEDTALDNEFTALHLAALYGHDEVVEVLLANGVDYKTFNKYTDLHIGAGIGYAEVVEVILRVEMVGIREVDSQMTPLHVAANMGREKVVKALLEKRADITAKILEGATAILFAASRWHEKAVERAKGRDTMAMKYGDWSPENILVIILHHRQGVMQFISYLNILGFIYYLKYVYK